MTPADYALFISIASIFISIGALLWNICQKFIFVKPGLQVSFGMGRVFNTSAGVATPSGQRLLSLTVINMGPGPVVLQACIGKGRKHWWQRTKSHAMLVPIHGDPTDPNPIGIGPYGGGLPAKIDAGEVKQFYFPYEKECFLKEGLARVGINDTYHRMIWCHRSDIRKAYQSYRRDFGNNPNGCLTEQEN